MTASRLDPADRARELEPGAQPARTAGAAGAARRVWAFIRGVLSDFRRNQGFLLAGAVAYYTLLSLVPMLTLLLIGLSHIIDQKRLIDTVAANIDFLVPGQADAITHQVAGFLARRQVVGGVGIVVLLVFSSMAFGVLENAMVMIFKRRSLGRRRHAVVSAVLPYFFVTLLGVGLIMVTLVTGALEAVGRSSVRLLGHAWSLAGVSRALLHLLGTAGSALLLTALYMVLPVGRVTFRHALLGAVSATLLWEVVRHGLVWYFAHLSMVNVIYGSLATAVIVLLTLEAAALILLLGAQIIAELEPSSPASRLRPE